MRVRDNTLGDRAFGTVDAVTHGAGSRERTTQAITALMRVAWRHPRREPAHQRTNARLYRAYLLKEQLRLVFHQDTPEQAIAQLDRWLAWAGRSRSPRS